MPGIQSDVDLLLHCDGSNGGTSFLDSSLNAHSLSVSGTVTTSTTQKKFGTTSGYFNTGRLNVPGSTCWNFGSNDLTVAFWWYSSSSARQWFFHTTSDYWFGLDYNSVGTGKLGLWVSSTGSSWNMINSDGGGNGICSTAITLNQWNHIAITRNGNNWKVFLNGVVDLSITVSGSIVNKSASGMYIGCHSSTTAPVVGYMDEWVIINGTALWTSGFTLPSDAYFLAAGDLIIGDLSSDYIFESQVIFEALRRFIGSFNVNSSLELLKYVIMNSSMGEFNTSILLESYHVLEKVVSLGDFNITLSYIEIQKLIQAFQRFVLRYHLLAGGSLNLKNDLNSLNELSGLLRLRNSLYPTTQITDDLILLNSLIGTIDDTLILPNRMTSKVSGNISLRNKITDKNDLSGTVIVRNRIAPEMEELDQFYFSEEHTG